MIKFKGKVTFIGPLVHEFIESGILVLFGEKAPEELREFSIIHDGKILESDLEKGDRVIIDNEEYLIMAVGSVANDNLANLGHLILKFNGENKASLPGDVIMELKPLPVISIGSIFKIEN